MAEISGILQMVIRIPGWFFFHESIAELTKRLTRPYTPTSTGWRWWQRWERNDRRILPFSLQISAAGKYRWLSWLSSSKKTLLSFVGLKCFANYFINVRHSSRFIQPDPFPEPTQPTGRLEIFPWEHKRQWHPTRSIPWAYTTYRSSRNVSLGAQTSVAFTATHTL
jgi:hypothetical protein